MRLIALSVGNRAHTDSFLFSTVCSALNSNFKPSTVTALNYTVAKADKAAILSAANNQHKENNYKCQKGHSKRGKFVV